MCSANTCTAIHLHIFHCKCTIYWSTVANKLRGPASRAAAFQFPHVATLQHPNCMQSSKAVTQVYIYYFADVANQLAMDPLPLIPLSSSNVRSRIQQQQVVNPLHTVKTKPSSHNMLYSGQEQHSYCKVPTPSPSCSIVRASHAQICRWHFQNPQISGKRCDWVYLNVLHWWTACSSHFLLDFSRIHHWSMHVTLVLYKYLQNKWALQTLPCSKVHMLKS